MALSTRSVLIHLDSDDGSSQLASLQDSIADDANLLILGFSTAQPENLSEILPRIETLWPRATMVGVYGPRLIHEGVVTEHSLLIQFVTFEKTKLRLNYVPWEVNDRDVGEQLFDPVCRSDTRLALTFLGSENTDAYELTHWVNQQYPDLAIIGGRSVDSGDGWLYADGQFLHQHALTVTLSNASLGIVTRAYSDWQAIGRTWSVTKAVGETLYELDYQPAQDLYARYLPGEQPSDGDGNEPEGNKGPRVLSEAALKESFPLMCVNDEKNTLSSPVRCNKDGGVIMSAPLKEGDRVRFAYSHPSMTLEQINQGAESLQQQRSELILSFNCALRQGSDNGETERELQSFQAVASLTGIFCFGGLMHQQGKTRMLQHSVVAVGIAEDPAAEKPMPIVQHDALAPLFRLIQASDKDHERVNEKLATDIRRTTHELLRKFETDSVTGLANRVALLRCLREDEPWSIAQVCSLKINNLRQINNLYGYSVGDHLLRSLSTAIQSDITELLPSAARVFRGSPNEFLVVAPDACPMNSFYKGMARLTERMQSQSDMFGDTNVQNVLPILLTAGTAHTAELPVTMTDSRENLLIKASEARRHAYRHQLPIARSIDLPVTDRRKSDGLIWLSRIRTALGRGDILPYVQPLFDRQGNVHHVEALMRVRHDGLIYSPSSFLELVKPTQLYPRLSMAMIDETFRLLKPHDVGFTLNFTTRDLANEALIDRVKFWLKNGVSAARVTLEIVESDSLRDFDRFTYTLHELRRMGCKLAIDDFGSAYSNLERVMRLKPDWIKLDGSLIQNLIESEVNQILVQRVVQLCQDLNIRTVAEHVHDKATMAMLMRMGVDFFQGFYLAEPVPADTFNVLALKPPGSLHRKNRA